MGENIDALRSEFQGRLKQSLTKAELCWGSNEEPSDHFVQLRLAAQTLADQLSHVEEMEAKLERMLEEKRLAPPPG